MKKKLLTLLVLAVLIAMAWLLAHRSAGIQRVSGTIETDEVRAGSRYGGRVESIRAGEGDDLTNGQLIVRLQAPELTARRAKVAALLSEQEAGPRTQEIASASNEWRSLEADLELALIERRRTEDLLKQKTISVSERDHAVSQAKALEMKMAAARDRYEELAAGTRPEQIAQTRAEQAEVEAQLAELNISAPADCVLETLHVKVGDVVPPNGTVATLLLKNEKWIRVYVPEPWLAHIRVGLQVDVRVDGYPDRSFTGSVEQINRKAEFTPRNVQTVGERIRQVFGVKVRLSDSEDRLRPGMAADVTFAGVPRIVR